MPSKPNTKLLAARKSPKLHRLELPSRRPEICPLKDTDAERVWQDKQAGMTVRQLSRKWNLTRDTVRVVIEMWGERVEQRAKAERGAGPTLPPVLSEVQS